MKLLSTENTTNHDGRPANRCLECGGIDFFDDGDGLKCLECESGGNSGGITRQRYQATAINGRLRWRLVGGVDVSGPAGGGEINHDEPRIDPETPLEFVYASPRLDWFTAGLGTLLSRDVDLRGVPGIPSGVYRRLDQKYFAWLVEQQVDRGSAADYPPEFFEITTAAQIAGVFGDWSRDVEKWPTVAPRGYVGPREFWFEDREIVSGPAERACVRYREYDGARSWQAGLLRGGR